MTFANLYYLRFLSLIKLKSLDIKCSRQLDHYSKIQTIFHFPQIAGLFAKMEGLFPALSMQDVLRDDPVCVFCERAYSRTGEQFVRLPCGHIVGETCMCEWISHADFCPVCEKIIPVLVTDDGYFLMEEPDVETRETRQGTVSSPNSASSSKSEWEQWPEEALYETHEYPGLGFDYEMALGEVKLESESDLSDQSEEWEQWTGEALSEAHVSSTSYADINERLEEALHPALRSNFRIQERWDRAPEELLPVPLIPQVALSPPINMRPREELLSLHDYLQEERPHAKSRRHKSEVPSSDSHRPHSHRKRHHSEFDAEYLGLDQHDSEKPHYRHRGHRHPRPISPVRTPDAHHNKDENHAKRRRRSDRPHTSRQVDDLASQVSEHYSRRPRTTREESSSVRQSKERYEDGQIMKRDHSHRHSSFRTFEALQADSGAILPDGRHYHGDARREERKRNSDLPSRLRRVFSG